MSELYYRIYSVSKTTTFTFVFRKFAPYRSCRPFIIKFVGVFLSACKIISAIKRFTCTTILYFINIVFITISATAIPIIFRVVFSIKISLFFFIFISWKKLKRVNLLKYAFWLLLFFWFWLGNKKIFFHSINNIQK